MIKFGKTTVKIYIRLLGGRVRYFATTDPKVKIRTISKLQAIVNTDTC